MSRARTVEVEGGDAVARGSTGRFLGIDVGAETLKLVELRREGNICRVERTCVVEHQKAPGALLRRVLEAWDFASMEGAAATGRLASQLNLPRVPARQALARGARFRLGQDPATLVSIGSRGFSVLELRAADLQVYRENSRCSQGTGNFLRQLVERFGMTVEEASERAAAVTQPAPLSGRCPVILKTDMTHLANKGENRDQILAGLFDAVAENVFTLIKPGVSPSPVVLVGGVSRSARVREAFGRRLAEQRMTLTMLPGEDGLLLEAMGAALVAAEHPGPMPSLAALLGEAATAVFEKVPALGNFLGQVRRMTAPPVELPPFSVDVLLGFDIGSTGSKLVALDPETSRPVWEGYRRTGGDPVGAAQDLLRQFAEGAAGRCRVVGVGATGSGREIVGSLLATCYGKDAVYILNEIAAHAAGACHHDPRVDTIFEIGGQDAKYIRLAEGRVVDCAMNEACSAGTGSFIEEQGRKFSGIEHVAQLSDEALAAAEGVSLGQHCSVFMAEVIDAAVAAGVDRRSIIAGLYDSIIQNYLNRVKGNRSVGQVIFCQGMPFASDALAAAVARQTGAQVIIPPNPGTVGALGIALLAGRELPWKEAKALDPQAFLGAKIAKKETFVCRATVGCGGAGNRCRIDCLRTVVEDRQQTFTWGGGCSLHDKGTRKRKLPNLSPDAFREREELVQELLAPVVGRGEGRPVALTSEFTLKGLIPFFATYLAEAGFRVTVRSGGDQATLKRGIQEANVPFCAPMQLFHGVVSEMAEGGEELVVLPMLRSLAPQGDEVAARTCPIVQAGPDIVRLDLEKRLGGRWVSPVIDFGPGHLNSEVFRRSVWRMSEDLGVPEALWARAFERAVAVQGEFERRCLEIGRRTLEFGRAQDIPVVVVLGRPYTIYNKVLNSNVPSLLREQGALAVPVDCYPVGAGVPTYRNLYWGYAQRILRAARQVRESDGVYAVYCSNYSCGPDSFNLHFFAYLMEGKPFAVIETDGHSGDAGTKTRLEAFLHCVAQDREAAEERRAANDFTRLQLDPAGVEDFRRGGEVVLVPDLGPSSAVVAACFRAAGLRAEALPPPDHEALRLGRRHTSGKECLPMTLTLGTILQRLQRATDGEERFAVLMPSSHGPCRFGVYNLLNRITFERLGWSDRVRVWSPDDTGYFEGLPGGTVTHLFAGVTAGDALLAALHDVRPVERTPGQAEEIYRRYRERLLQQVEEAGTRGQSTTRGLGEIATGRLYGLPRLLRSAAREFAACRSDRQVPTVLLVGEIYVRCVAPANDAIIERLEARGLRVRLAPVGEWIEYADHVVADSGGDTGWGAQAVRFLQERIRRRLDGVVAAELGWGHRPGVPETIEAARPYVREALLGEAVLTVGGPVDEWKRGEIHAAVNVGPLECMPSKISEAQLFHAAQREGLLTLSVPFNGDPVDPGVLDNFAFEVWARYRRSHPPQASVTGDPR